MSLQNRTTRQTTCIPRAFLPVWKTHRISSTPKVSTSNGYRHGVDEGWMMWTLGRATEIECLLCDGHVIIIPIVDDSGLGIFRRLSSNST